MCLMRQVDSSQAEFHILFHPVGRSSEELSCQKDVRILFLTQFAVETLTLFSNSKNVYALEERNNLFSKDPHIRKFDAERVLCDLCDKWLSVPPDDHQQASEKWLQHRESCKQASTSPIISYVYRSSNMRCFLMIVLQSHNSYLTHDPSSNLSPTRFRFILSSPPLHPLNHKSSITQTHRPIPIRTPTLLPTQT